MLGSNQRPLPYQGTSAFTAGIAASVNSLWISQIPQRRGRSVLRCSHVEGYAPHVSPAASSGLGRRHRYRAAQRQPTF
jgi:hypothetical protein